MIIMDSNSVNHNQSTSCDSAADETVMAIKEEDTVPIIAVDTVNVAQTDVIMRDEMPHNEASIAVETVELPEVSSIKRGNSCDKYRNEEDDNGTENAKCGNDEDEDANNRNDQHEGAQSDEEDDPLALIKNVIKWKGDLGYLPGSTCRFKLDRTSGELLLVDQCHEVEEEQEQEEEEYEQPLRKRQRLITDKIADDCVVRSGDRLSICLNCNACKFREEFSKNGKYCQECSHLNPILMRLLRNLSATTTTPTLEWQSPPPPPSLPLTPPHHADHDQDEQLDAYARYLHRKPQHNETKVECSESTVQSSLQSTAKEQSQFSWKQYLEKCGSTPVPLKSFLPTQLAPPRMKAQFAVGMKLEGIDPYHPSRFCVLTIAQIQGARLRLHFDGYRRKYDFWLNANSEFIFPVGFCRDTNRRLEPPGGFRKLPQHNIEDDNNDDEVVADQHHTHIHDDRSSSPYYAESGFDWHKYLLESNAISAPPECFVTPHEDREKVTTVAEAGFGINLKLEAVDKANSALICVASIKDILNENLLIHFDGWDDSYDYWAHYTSNLIHPINWCKSKGKSLTAPKDYKNDNFSWDEYLCETGTQAVPARAFVKPKPSGSNFHNWKSGMKLEAVDVRNPQLIRVATVASRAGHTVKIHFDGWEDKYDYWIDDDCSNLHPVNWCAETNHPLEPPPSNDSKSHTSCPIANCNGLGHQKWHYHKRHNRAEDCPYFHENLDYEPPDRYDPSDEEDQDEDEQESYEQQIEQHLAQSRANVRQPYTNAQSKQSNLLEEEEEDKVLISQKRKILNGKNFTQFEVEDSSSSSNSSSSKNGTSSSSSSSSSKWSRPTVGRKLTDQYCDWFGNSYVLPLIEQGNQVVAASMPASYVQSCRALWSNDHRLNRIEAQQVITWNYGQVEQFVRHLTDCIETSRIFAEQQIDGEVLLMLKLDDLIDRMHIKLGPAVKIYSIILSFCLSLFGTRVDVTHI